MPEREDDHLTPATRLLEKRREMSEVESALSAQKEVKTYMKRNTNLKFTIWCITLEGCVKDPNIVDTIFSVLVSHTESLFHS